MSEKEEVGPTCLYKDGGSEIFTGEAVAKALKDGWKDEPAKKKEAKKEKE